MKGTHEKNLSPNDMFGKKGQEQLFLKEGFVHFTNDKMESFVQAWINDVANLSETDDNSKLTFPEGL